LGEGLLLRSRSHYDRFENAFQRLDRLVVPETQHAIAGGFKDSGSSRIPVNAVLTAVEFDDQPCFHAQEVRHIGSDACLPPKLHTGKLSIS
jgi:hypothetical protein